MSRNSLKIDVLVRMISLLADITTRVTPETFEVTLYEDGEDDKRQNKSKLYGVLLFIKDS